MEARARSRASVFGALPPSARADGSPPVALTAHRPLPFTPSLRIVVRHLAKPTAGATLGALADLLGGGVPEKRDVAALAIQAIASDERLGVTPGKAVVDGALVEVLLPRMIAIAGAKV